MLFGDPIRFKVSILILLDSALNAIHLLLCREEVTQQTSKRNLIESIEVLSACDKFLRYTLEESSVQC